MLHVSLPVQGMNDKFAIVFHVKNELNGRGPSKGVEEQTEDKEAEKGGGVGGGPGFSS